MTRANPPPSPCEGSPPDPSGDGRVLRGRTANATKKPQPTRKNRPRQDSPTRDIRAQETTHSSDTRQEQEQEQEKTDARGKGRQGARGEKQVQQSPNPRGKKSNQNKKELVTASNTKHLEHELVELQASLQEYKKRLHHEQQQTRRLNDQLRSHPTRPAITPVRPSLVPCPRVPRGKSLDIRQAIGVDHDRFNSIRTLIRHAADAEQFDSTIHINKQQDSVRRIIEAVVEAEPFLARFQDAWPIRESLKVLKKSRVAYQKALRYGKRMSRHTARARAPELENCPRRADEETQDGASNNTNNGDDNDNDNGTIYYEHDLDDDTELDSPGAGPSRVCATPSPTTRTVSRSSSLTWSGASGVEE